MGWRYFCYGIPAYFKQNSGVMNKFSSFEYKIA